MSRASDFPRWAFRAAPIDTSRWTQLDRRLGAWMPGPWPDGWRVVGLDPFGQELDVVEGMPVK